MSNDLIPVAYALTETASYMEAMRATREFAAVSTSVQVILADNEQRAVDHYATVWHMLRGLEPTAFKVQAAVADARAYLADHLPELAVFVERVHNRMEETEHGHQVR